MPAAGSSEAERGDEARASKGRCRAETHTRLAAARVRHAPVLRDAEDDGLDGPARARRSHSESSRSAAAWRHYCKLSVRRNSWPARAFP